jgi:hypothetical protein
MEREKLEKLEKNPPSSEIKPEPQWGVEKQQHIHVPTPFPKIA